MEISISQYHFSLLINATFKMIALKNRVSIEKWIVKNKNSMEIDGSFNRTGQIDNEKILWNK